MGGIDTYASSEGSGVHLNPIDAPEDSSHRQGAHTVHQIIRIMMLLNMALSVWQADAQQSDRRHWMHGIEYSTCPTPPVSRIHLCAEAQCFDGASTVLAQLLLGTLPQTTSRGESSEVDWAVKIIQIYNSYLCS